MQESCISFILRRKGAWETPNNKEPPYLITHDTILSSITSSVLSYVNMLQFWWSSAQKTTILLQRSARLAFWPSLYLDSFGEEVLLNFLMFVILIWTYSCLLHSPLEILPPADEPTWASPPHSRSSFGLKIRCMLLLWTWNKMSHMWNL